MRLAALVLALLTVPASAEPQTYSGIAFPDRVAEFVRGKVDDFEPAHPGLGQSIAYDRGAWHANVYVYDLRRGRIPDDPASEVVKAEFAQAKSDVFRARQKGGWAKVDLLRSFNLPE
jgi:hypothetical protein